MNDQRSLATQLNWLHSMANTNGMYDAADWVQRHRDSSAYSSDLHHVVRVIEWSADAGRREALLAQHEGREVDPDGGMGLWQAFQDEVLKRYEVPRNQRDLLVMLYARVYATTATECLKALRDRGIK